MIIRHDSSFTYLILSIIAYTWFFTFPPWISPVLPLSYKRLQVSCDTDKIGSFPFITWWLLWLLCSLHHKKELPYPLLLCDSDLFLPLLINMGNSLWHRHPLIQVLSYLIQVRLETLSSISMLMYHYVFLFPLFHLHNFHLS